MSRSLVFCLSAYLSPTSANHATQGTYKSDSWTVASTSDGSLGGEDDGHFNIPDNAGVPDPMHWGAVAISPDGNFLVAVSRQNTAGQTDARPGTTQCGPSFNAVCGCSLGVPEYCNELTGQCGTTNAFRDATTETKYDCGSAFNGENKYGHIYTSSDAGGTWVERLGSPIAMWSCVAIVTGTYVAQTQTQTGTVIFAGQGGAFTDQGQTGFDALTTSKGPIYKSTDQGVTWTAVTDAGGLDMATRDWRAIAAWKRTDDPTKVGVVALEWKSNKIWRSLDGGTNWVQHEIRDLATADFTLKDPYSSATRAALWYTSFAAGDTPADPTWYDIAVSSDGKKQIAVAGNYGLFYAGFGLTYDSITNADATADTGDYWFWAGKTNAQLITSPITTSTAAAPALVTQCGPLHGGAVCSCYYERPAHVGGVTYQVNKFQYTQMWCNEGTGMCTAPQSGGTRPIGAYDCPSAETDHTSYNYQSVDMSNDGTKIVVGVAGGAVRTATWAAIERCNKIQSQPSLATAIVSCLSPPVFSDSGLAPTGGRSFSSVACNGDFTEIAAVERTLNTSAQAVNPETGLWYSADATGAHSAAFEIQGATVFKAGRYLGKGLYAASAHSLALQKNDAKRERTALALYGTYGGIWMHPLMDAGALQDPHLTFHGGGQADFRGRDRTSFCFLSAPNLQVNVMTEDRSFQRWGGQVVHGSFITRLFVKARSSKTGQVFRVAVLAEEWKNFQLCAADADPALAQPLCTKRTQAEIDDVEVTQAPFGRTFVRAAGWEVFAGRRKLRKPLVDGVVAPQDDRRRWFLDVTFKVLDDDSALSSRFGNSTLGRIAPHGIIGQSFDGSNITVSGKLDRYGDGAVFKTEAQAEGAIEGYYTEYITGQPFSHEFKYARFDATDPIAPRDASRLPGPKMAAQMAAGAGATELHGVEEQEVA